MFFKYFITYANSEGVTPSFELTPRFIMYWKAKSDGKNPSNVSPEDKNLLSQSLLN